MIYHLDMMEACFKVWFLLVDLAKIVPCHGTRSQERIHYANPRIERSEGVPLMMIAKMHIFLIGYSFPCRVMSIEIVGFNTLMSSVA